LERLGMSGGTTITAHETEDEMAEPILLKGVTPAVDPKKVGISYSGGGHNVVVELGIARAFVQKGIVPAVITGASAGSLAGLAHALDVHDGKGIDLAAELLSHITNRTLGIDVPHAVGELVIHREHAKSIADNSSIGPIIKDGIRRVFGWDNVTNQSFVPPDFPKLMIATTDVQRGTTVWFTDDAPASPVPIEEAVIASSAIPGLFPWQDLSIGELSVALADGGVVDNQPLSNLADQGCGKIYACAVGSSDTLPPPANGLDNALRTISLMMRQCTKLEEDYVRGKLGDTGKVHHIHPVMDVPIHQFNFTPELVRRLVDEACAKTLDWLDKIERGEVVD
jgi:NTE family protein